MPQVVDGSSGGGSEDWNLIGVKDTLKPTDASMKKVLSDFEDAVVYVNTVTKRNSADVSQPLRMELYGYYMQATKGPYVKAKDSASANANDSHLKQKFEAWDRLGNMSAEAAMTGYVKTLSKLRPEWPQAVAAMRQERSRL